MNVRLSCYIIFYFHKDFEHIKNKSRIIFDNIILIRLNIWYLDENLNLINEKYTYNPLWKYAPQPLWYLPSVLHISLTLFKSIFINVYHNHNLFDKIFWDDLKFVVSITFPVNAFVVFHLSNKRHITRIGSHLLNTTYKKLHIYVWTFDVLLLKV